MLTVGDLFGNATAQTPVVLIVASLVLTAAAWIARRAAGSLRRQGVRLGAAEQLLGMERTRRRQLEQTVREYGIRVPYWPDDPPELYRPVVDDDEQGPDLTNELPTQHFSRHALRRTS